MFHQIIIITVVLLVNFYEKIFYLHLVFLFYFIFIHFSFTINSFIDASKETQTILPLTEQATKIYDEICSKGLNKKDFSVVYKYFVDLENEK